MDGHEKIEKIDIMTYVINFLKTVKKFWIAMVLGTILIMAVFFIRNRSSYVPMYQSQITFTINRLNSNYGSSSEQIRQSLPYILNSSYMKNMVKEDLGLSWFPATVTLEGKEFAEFYVLKVTADSPEMAYNILNSVVENCPKASLYVLGQITLNILDASGIVNTPVNSLDNRTNLIKGFVLGVVICVLIAFLYTITNRTVGTEEELKKYFSVSSLAALPSISFKKRRKAFDKHIHIYNDKIGPAYLENIRILRARVTRFMERTNAKTVLVTSSVPKEGKSTVAANLALSLAEKGAKVILVDLDLRNPSVADVLGIAPKNNIGISEFLSRKKSEMMITKIKRWNLAVLYAGQVPNNPIELLKRKELRNAIASLRSTYDYVIIDTPPVAMLSDASIIAKNVDAAIYVVKQDYARIERVIEGIDALSLAEVPIIGVVMNCVENAMSGYRSYRYGNYGESKVNSNHRDNQEDDLEYVDVLNPWE